MTTVLFTSEYCSYCELTAPNIFNTGKDPYLRETLLRVTQLYYATRYGADSDQGVSKVPLHPVCSRAKQMKLITPSIPDSVSLPSSCRGQSLTGICTVFAESNSHSLAPQSAKFALSDGPSSGGAEKLSSSIKKYTPFSRPMSARRSHNTMPLPSVSVSTCSFSPQNQNFHNQSGQWKEHAPHLPLLSRWQFIDPSWLRAFSSYNGIQPNFDLFGQPSVTVCPNTCINTQTKAASDIGESSSL